MKLQISSIYDRKNLRFAAPTGWRMSIHFMPRVVQILRYLSQRTIFAVICATACTWQANAQQTLREFIITSGSTPHEIARFFEVNGPWPVWRTKEVNAYVVVPSQLPRFCFRGIIESWQAAATKVSVEISKLVAIRPLLTYEADFSEQSGFAALSYGKVIWPSHKQLPSSRVKFATGIDKKEYLKIVFNEHTNSIHHSYSKVLDFDEDNLATFNINLKTVPEYLCTDKLSYFRLVSLVSSPTIYKDRSMISRDVSDDQLQVISLRVRYDKLLYDARRPDEMASILRNLPR